MKYAIGIEYSGTHYNGWQKQKHSKSVQPVLEKALSKIANQTITIYCAGRTDAGVHATGQVAHFTTEAYRPDHAWLLGTNANLPADIKLTWIQAVEQDFHARFSALSRHYQYVMFARGASSAFLSNLAVWQHQQLDLKAMNQAAEYLLGEQDFSAFRSSQCQSQSTKRYIEHARFYQKGYFIVFDIVGNAFLHHMVRNIVGTMLEVGVHKRLPDSIQSLMHSKDRTLAGKTAPPHGLYLVGVSYPQVFNIPEAMKVDEMFNV